MGRKILAVVVALIASFAVIFIVQMLNSFISMPPSSEVMNDPAKLRDFMSSLPPMIYIIVYVGYFLGSLTGGYIVTKMSLRESPGIILPLLIGVILTIGGILNFFVWLPGQPMWFVALSLVTYIPIALVGHRLGRN